MKKKLFIIAFSAATWGMHSQVGIGTLNPNSSSMLDVVSRDKGVLIPRVSLQNIYDTTTVQGSVNGNYENSLLVFNINENEQIEPGYFYWFDMKWNRFINQEDLLRLDTNTRTHSITVSNNNLVILDTENNTVNIPISDVNILTYLRNNLDGTYTYISENNTETEINVVQDVKNQFQQIIGDTNVKNILDRVIKNTSNIVHFNGYSFSYIDDNGEENVIDLQEIIRFLQNDFSLVNGNHTTVNQDSSTRNRNSSTAWRVDVATAKGAINNVASTHGVVKEKDINPTVSINQNGELSINNANVNRVKHINRNYTALLEDAIILGDASSSDINITLPNATENLGKRLVVKKEDNNEDFFIHVYGNISGVTNGLYTALPYSGWEFVSDGNHWKVINKF